MNILVTKNNVQIDNREEVHQGEYNVNKLYFSFTDDYAGLAKMAVFSNLFHSYELAITNNECNIPPQILTDRGCFTLGVYAYTIVDEQIVKRYSPTPIELVIENGSYITALNPAMTEPTLFQTFAQQVEEQFDDVTEAIGDNAEAISVIQDRATALEEGKQDKLTAGSHITINNNVISSDGEPNVITKIQKNGTDLPINNETVDIPVPTKTSDISNDSGFITKEVNNLTNYLLKVNTGATLEATINNTTYVMTLKLKNSSGTALSTQTIDLPLETMVINASYDSATKEIVLYLKNGNTVRFSVADLISGLQEEITPSNKLSSDLVDDTNKTNKFVTQAEKTKLAGIEAGAEVNKIDTIQVDGVTQPINNKTVNITGMANLQDQINVLEEENEELKDQIPTATAEGTSIHVEDSSNLSFKEVELLGNASQDTSILYYKCVGTETGDYYFTYDNTNYQFTMPTITANELLTFNTTTLKLYQGTTEITTTTDNTGTLITLSATPSPDYAVPIKVVTGNNTIHILGNNFFNINSSVTATGCTYNVENGEITQTNTNSRYSRTTFNLDNLIVGEQYTINCDYRNVSNSPIQLRIFDERNVNIVAQSSNPTQASGSLKITFIAQTKTHAIRFYSNTAGEPNSATVSFYNIMLAFGDTPQPYEPYTTERTQLISLGVNNFFDASNVTYDNTHYRANDGTITSSTGSGYTTSVTPVKPNTTYTISGKICNTGNFGRVYFLDNNQDWISRSDGRNGNITFTTPENCYYIQFQYRTDYVDFSTIQIEEGSIVHSYSPYGQEPIELCGIGDYKDRIFKAGDSFYDTLTDEQKAQLTIGKWYKYGAIHKAVYNGTEGFVVQNTYDDYILYRYNPATAYRKITGLYNIMCNRLQANGNTKNSILGQTSGYQIQVGLSKEFATDITTFNLWLSSNNLITYYVLGTPTTTEITDTTLIGQLENWLKMKTNRNITNIYTDTGDETPTLTVEYRQDLTTLFDDLTNAIVSLGNNT